MCMYASVRSSIQLAGYIDDYVLLFVTIKICCVFYQAISVYIYPFNITQILTLCCGKYNDFSPRKVILIEAKSTIAKNFIAIYDFSKSLSHSCYGTCAGIKGNIGMFSTDQKKIDFNHWTGTIQRIHYIDLLNSKHNIIINTTYVIDFGKWKSVKMRSHIIIFYNLSCTICLNIC